MTLHFIFTIKIDILLYCIGSILPITRIYAYKYMHVISFHVFCLFFIFFAFTLKKTSVIYNWSKPPFVGLYLK